MILFLNILILSRAATPESSAYIRIIKPESFWLRIGQNLDLNPESQLRRRSPNFKAYLSFMFYLML